MTSTGLHHIAIRVKDVRTSERFYTEVVGATVIPLIEEPDDPSGRASLIKLPDGTYFEVFPEGVWPPAPEAPSLGLFHFAVGVPDVDAAYADALANGATTCISPETIELPLYPGRQIRHAFVFDLNGDVCEFVEPDWVDQLLAG